MFTSYKNKLSVIKQANKLNEQQFFSRSRATHTSIFGGNPLKIRRHSVSTIELIFLVHIDEKSWHIHVFSPRTSLIFLVVVLCPELWMFGKSVLRHTLKRVLLISKRLRWFQEILKPFHVETSWKYLLNFQRKINDRMQWSVFKW